MTRPLLWHRDAEALMTALLRERPADAHHEPSIRQLANGIARLDGERRITAAAALEAIQYHNPDVLREWLTPKTRVTHTGRKVWVSGPGSPIHDRLRRAFQSAAMALPHLADLAARVADE